MPTRATSLADAVAVARPIVERIVWCTAATTGPDGPRTRLMHPVWWWDGEAPTALVTARPTPVKLAHLAFSDRISCSYWDQAHDTVVLDATATWVEGDDRAAAWEAVKAVAAPVGFDPALIWPDGPQSADCRFLRLRAHRVVATAAGAEGVRWTSSPGPG